MSYMKKNIHPQYGETSVVCSCGNNFTLYSTTPEMRVELCYKCHPFYTGEQKIVDTANRVKSFENKRQEAQKIQVAKMKQKDEMKEKDKKRDNRSPQGPMTLRDMMQALQNKK